MRNTILKTLAVTGACLLQSVAFGAQQEKPTKMYNEKVYVELTDPNISNEELRSFDVSQVPGEEAQNAVRALIAARTQGDDQVASTNESGLRAERWGRRGFYGRGFYGRGYYGRGYYGRGYYGYRGYRYGYYGYPGYYDGATCVGAVVINVCF